MAATGAALLVALLTVATLAGVLAPHDPAESDLRGRLRPPMWVSGGSAQHVLGTDHLGRDILSRLMYGARVSLLVGFTAVAIGGTIGVLIGLAAGYFGGMVDAVLMRCADIQLALPYILLIIALVAVLGGGIVTVVGVLAFARWMPYARIVRGQVLSYKHREFVEAARTIGAGHWRVMSRHVLPNVMNPVIVIGTFAVASTIISEATLSFLGLGVENSIPTWGGMLADGKQYLTSAWWLATFPGLAIMLTVLGINLLGDWLRDATDPRLDA